MKRDHSGNKDHSGRIFRHPVSIALAVAVFGVLAMLIVDHGPWNRPRIQPAHLVNETTTADAARVAGAMVTPTAPKGRLEPVPPGPKPAHPANPPANPVTP
jgi:hypothetical protein